MDVIRAKTAGFCMGVGLALQKLDTALEQPCEGRTCTLGPIIHNPQVLADYEALGVFCAQDPSQLNATDRVLIRAHGITRQVEEAVRATGADVVDATCPKVKRAQLAIERATRDGEELLLFGEADHPEVRGLVSYAHGPAHVFGSRDELAALHVDPERSYVLASQTTQDRSVFEQLEKELRDRLPRLKVLATICDATRERQEEARSIAAQVDAMVVVAAARAATPAVWPIWRPRAASAPIISNRPKNCGPKTLPARGAWALPPGLPRPASSSTPPSNGWSNCRINGTSAGHRCVPRRPCSLVNKRLCRTERTAKKLFFRPRPLRSCPSCPRQGPSDIPLIFSCICLPAALVLR
mgnify:CR=1 FL=1